MPRVPVPALAYVFSDQQKDQIHGVEYEEGSFYSIIKDADGLWIMTQPTAQALIPVDSIFNWVFTLPLVPFKKAPPLPGPARMAAD